MKRKFSLNRTTGRRELVIQSQKNEELNPRQARWICGGPDRVFLRTAYTLAGETGRCILSYDVNGLVSFKNYIRKNTLSGTQYVTMLTDLARAYGSCTEGQDKQFWQRSLLFDVKSVFVDSEARLRFVFIPLDGLPFSINNSPLELLRVLGDTKKVKLETPNDVGLANRLGAYVLNERDTFSFNAFRSFLRRECGVEVNPDGSLLQTGSDTTGEMRHGPVIPTEREVRHIPGGVSMSDLVGRNRVPEQVEIDTTAGRDVPMGGHVQRFVLRRISTGETYYMSSGQTLLLGRGSKCKPQLLGNPKVSRHHAQVTVANSAVTIVDLGSTNGTYVGARRLQPNAAVQVPLGQRFSLGQEELVIDVG